MAESIIAASTRVTFSTIANTAIALKRLQDGMKHAPENLSWLSEQLHCLQVVISNLETSISPSLDGCTGAEHLVPHLKGCQTALNTLQTLINDLSTDLFSGPWNKRTKAKFKTVMKEEQVSRYLQQLQFTMRLLCLAQQNYAIKLAELLPGRLLAALDHQTLQLTTKQPLNQPISNYSMIKKPPPAHDKGSDFSSLNFVRWQKPNSYGYIYYATETASQQHLLSTTRLQIQFPRWLINTAWDLYIRHACSGWKVNLRWSTIHNTTFACQKSFWAGTRDEIFTALAECGFQLHDRFGNGDTLTKCAIVSGRYDIALELLEQGAPLDPENDFPHGIFQGHILHRAHQRVQWSGLRLFIRKLMQRNMLSEILENPLQSSFPPSALNRHLLKDIEMFNLLIETLKIPRPEVLWNNIPWLTMPAKTVVDLLDSLNQDEKARFYKSSSEATINSIDNFAYSFFTTWIENSVFTTAVPSPLRYAFDLCTILGAHSPLRLLSEPNPQTRAITPLYKGLMFMQFMKPFHRSRKSQSKCDRECRARLQQWLRALSIGGVDLEQYGRQEVAVLRRFITKYEGFYFYVRVGGILYYPVELVQIDFGPKPEDWNLHWEYGHVEYAREFWQRVEFEFAAKMPGTWIDD